MKTTSTYLSRLAALALATTTIFAVSAPVNAASAPERRVDALGTSAQDIAVAINDVRSTQDRLPRFIGPNWQERHIGYTDDHVEIGFYRKGRNGNYRFCVQHQRGGFVVFDGRRGYFTRSSATGTCKG